VSIFPKQEKKKMANIIKLLHNVNCFYVANSLLATFLLMWDLKSVEK